MKLRWRSLFGLGGLLALMACDQRHPATGGAGGPAGGEGQLPAGTIRLHEHLYMVPLGEDDGGCRMYRPDSDTLATLTVIYYRRPDGSFTTDRREADCSPNHERGL